MLREATNPGFRTKLQSEVPWSKVKKGRIFHWTEDRRMFSVENKWVLFERRVLQFSAWTCSSEITGSSRKVGNTVGSRLKLATGNRVLGRKDRRQASSSAPTVKEQTDVHCSYSREAIPDKRTRILCVCGCPRRAYVCCRLGSFNAHAEQKWFELRWSGYFAEIQNPGDSGDR